MRGREGGWSLRCSITLGALQGVRYMKQKGMDTDVAMGIKCVKRSEGVTTAGDSAALPLLTESCAGERGDGA